MPKSKSQTAGEVLQKYIDDYQTNPFAVSKSLGVTYQTVTHIIQGKSRVTPQMAIRLSKYFSTTPTFWLDLQAQSEIAGLQADKKFTAQITKIPKAPKGKAKQPAKPKKVNKLSTAKPGKQAAKAKSKKKVKAFKTGRAKKK